MRTQTNVELTTTAVKDVAKELHLAVSRIVRPADYCTSGRVPLVLPGLEVAGLGPVGLPLTTSQAQELKTRCAQAPYGKGEETLVDVSVRRVWHLQPNQFSLTNPGWSETLLSVVARVQAGLGLKDQLLEAHLYDLLLYEEGGFFLHIAMARSWTAWWRRSSWFCRPSLKGVSCLSGMTGRNRRSPSAATWEAPSRSSTPRSTPTANTR